VKIPLIFICYFLFQVNLAGQIADRKDTTQHKKIEFLNADEAIFDENAQPPVLRIRGRVVMRHQDVYMFCDSAWRYSDRNAFDGFGLVHIQQGDSVDAYGDTLRYDGDKKVAFLSGNVLVKDRGTILRSPRLTYNLGNRIIYYSDSSVTNSGKNSITSQVGLYESRQKRMAFKGNVIIRNKDYLIRSDTVFYHTDTDVAYFFGPTTITGDSVTIFCRFGWHDTNSDISSFAGGATVSQKSRILSGDSLYYDGTNGYGRARFHVILKDTTEKAFVFGNFAETFEKKGYSYITDSVTLILQVSDDSIFLSSDTLHVWEDEECDKVIQAAHQVRFYLRDLQGVCDSLVFFVGDSLLQLYRTPVLWSENNQMISRFINVYLKYGKIHRFEMYEQSLVISQEDSAYFNQLGSIFMNGYFDNENLERIEARGAAASIYYPQEEDGEFIGMNNARAEEIIIWLKDKKVEKIKFFPSPKGILIPLAEIQDKNSKLQGFTWIPELRPSERYDIYSNKKTTPKFSTGNQ